MNAVSMRMMLAIAAGGAVGSVLRYLISTVTPRATGAFPVGTFIVNIAGSFLVALFARLLSTPDSSPITRAALTIGFCGGFTTFSTFSSELVTLAQEGRMARAVVYAAASICTGVIAVLVGFAVGDRLLLSRG